MRDARRESRVASAKYEGKAPSRCLTQRTREPAKGRMEATNAPILPFILSILSIHVQFFRPSPPKPAAVREPDLRFLQRRRLDIDGQDEDKKQRREGRAQRRCLTQRTRETLDGSNAYSHPAFHPVHPVHPVHRCSLSLPFPRDSPPATRDFPPDPPAIPSRLWLSLGSRSVRFASWRLLRGRLRFPR